MKLSLWARGFVLGAVFLLPGCGGDKAANTSRPDQQNAAAESAEHVADRPVQPVGHQSDVADLQTNLPASSSTRTAASRTVSSDAGINPGNKGSELDKLFPALENAPRPKPIGTDTKTLRYPNNKVKVRWQVKQFSDDSEVNHGPYVEYWSNGQIFKEGQFRDGVQDGQWKYWHENGKIHRTVTYNDGKLEGTFDVFRDDGTKEMTRSYHGGLKDGEWLNYDSTGEKILSRREYRFDLPHGTWNRYFASGQPVLEEHYKEGLLDGARKVWFENGQLREELSFRDGKRHGKYTRWDEDGTVQLELEFRNGEPVVKEDAQETETEG